MTSPSSEPRLDLRVLFACWVLVAVMVVARSFYGLASVPLILDTDDAMRLTIVHDFLAGQGWFDQVQHRLNVPYGAEIHWSRLIDLPEAALLILLRPFGGLADTIAAYIWPLALLLGLLAINSKLALRLGGTGAVLPALLLPALSLATLAEFSPGRFDHHGPQIILGIVMLGAVLGTRERPGLALIAGVAGGLSLGIGVEGLPMIAATVLAFGLLWVADRRRAGEMRDFGLSLASASVLALAIGIAPSRWFTPAYDEISIVYVAGMVLCGLAFTALSLLPLASRTARLLAAFAAAILVIGAVLLAWPGVVAGPYAALDPWLIANWIDRIAEAQPWWVSFSASPAYPLSTLLPVLIALVVVGWNAIRGGAEKRGLWLIYGLFLVVALVAMLLQIRAARMAVALAIPASAVLIAEARALYLSSKRLLPMLGLVGSWCISAGVLVGLAVNLLVPAPPSSARADEGNVLKSIHACLAPSAFASLAALPAQRIMTPIDLGSHMLLFTPHAVVAAPYHRNAEGVRDAFRFFNEPIGVARDILDVRGISLVVICPAMAEVHGIVDFAPDSFVALHEAGQLPNWLIDQTNPGSPLEIYAVAPR